MNADRNPDLKSVLSVAQKILDRLTILTLYKTVRALRNGNLNDDEQNIQRTIDSMAAVRRHESARLFNGDDK
jgi:hypothetical protein